MPGTRVYESVWIKAPAGTQWTAAGRASDSNGNYAEEGFGVSKPYTGTGGWDLVTLNPWTYTGGPFNPGIQVVSNTPQTGVSVWVDDLDIRVE
jgi:hypothetical protein